MRINPLTTPRSMATRCLYTTAVIAAALSTACGPNTTKETEQTVEVEPTGCDLNGQTVTYDLTLVDNGPPCRWEIDGVTAGPQCTIEKAIIWGEGAKPGIGDIGYERTNSPADYPYISSQTADGTHNGGWAHDKHRLECNTLGCASTGDYAVTINPTDGKECEEYGPIHIDITYGQ